RALLPERPVHVARQAEAASARAAAHDLDAQTVVHDLGRRDERLLRVVLRIERRDVPVARTRRWGGGLGDARDEPERSRPFVEMGGHVDALERAQAAEHLGPLQALL